METTDQITVPELRQRMKARRVTVTQLAREVGVAQTTMSGLLVGRETLGPKRARRLEAAILRLGLDQALATPLDDSKPVVIRIRRL